MISVSFVIKFWLFCKFSSFVRSSNLQRIVMKMMLNIKNTKSLNYDEKTAVKNIRITVNMTLVIFVKFTLFTIKTELMTWLVITIAWHVQKCIKSTVYNSRKTWSIIMWLVIYNILMLFMFLVHDEACRNLFMFNLCTISISMLIVIFYTACKQW